MSSTAYFTRSHISPPSNLSKHCSYSGLSLRRLANTPLFRCILNYFVLLRVTPQSSFFTPLATLKFSTIWWQAAPQTTQLITMNPVPRARFNLYPSPNIAWVIMKNEFCKTCGTYGWEAREDWGNIEIWKPRFQWEANIKKYLEEIERGNANSITLAQIRISEWLLWTRKWNFAYHENAESFLTN